MSELTFTVGGMKCGGCVDSVSRAISGVAGVADVQVDLESASARVTGDFDPRAVADAATAAGYPAAVRDEPD